MKTVTMRVDDATYQIIKTAAEGQKRNLSNFIEYATLQYISSLSTYCTEERYCSVAYSVHYVDNEEMDEIMADKAMMKR